MWRDPGMILILGVGSIWFAVSLAGYVAHLLGAH